MLIAAVAVVAVGSMDNRDAMSEAVGAYEAVLRQARAHAMRDARPMRLVFDPDNGSPQLMAQGDPVAAPGRFDHPAMIWPELAETQDVRLVRCERKVASDFAAAVAEDPVSDHELNRQALTFQPDGTSDTAELELELSDDHAGYHAVISIDGFTGTIATHWWSDQEASP
jgi:hypothetical protein